MVTCLGIVALCGCQPRPIAPAVPDGLFFLRWIIQGSSEEILVAKDEAAGRLDGDCGSALCPAGVDGDLLEVVLADPFISDPAPVGAVWRDTFQLSLGDGTIVPEVVTWTLVGADTTLSIDAGEFGPCLEIRRQSDQETGDARFFLGPQMGLVYLQRNDGRFLTRAELVDANVELNETRDGHRYSDDYFPLGEGNRWSYELWGARESIQQTYRIQ